MDALPLTISHERRMVKASDMIDAVQKFCEQWLLPVLAQMQVVVGRKSQDDCNVLFRYRPSLSWA